MTSPESKVFIKAKIAMMNPKTLVNVQHVFINEATDSIQDELLETSTCNNSNPDYDSEEWCL